MTIADLIAELKKYDPNAQLVAHSGADDTYWSLTEAKLCEVSGRKGSYAMKLEFYKEAPRD